MALNINIKKPASAPKAPSAELSQKLQRQAGARKAKNASGGKSKFVMFVGDDGAILVQQKGNKVLRRLYAPSPQPEHTKSMIELLQSQFSTPLYILLDVIDQQYVRQTFPPVSSLSVNKLVNRRLQRDFPPEDIKGSIPLGREGGGRKEWSYLLVSLAKTPHLQAWLDTLLELPNECKGIFLTPTEGQIYIPQLVASVLPEARTPWKLLLSHNKVGGMRQIVLRDNKLAFTRLTQSADDSNHALTAGNIEQEIQNTIDYLRRLGFGDNKDMSAVIVTSQEVIGFLDLKRFGMGAARGITPYDASMALGLEQAALSGDRYGDVIMAASFATCKKPAAKFLSGYMQQLATMYQAKLAIKMVGALVAALTLLSVGGDMLDYLEHSEAESIAKEQLQSEKAQISQAQNSISSLDKNTSLWSSVVAVYDAYQADKYAPIEFVEALAPHLDDTTRVNQLEWKYTALPPASGQPAPPPPQANQPITGPIEALVEIEFKGYYADQDQYSRAVDEFYSSLKEKMAAYNIVAENLPSAGGGASGGSVEISFDQSSQAQPFQQGQNKVRFKFIGPKPAAAAQAAPIAPAGLPQVGVP